MTPINDLGAGQRSASSKVQGAILFALLALLPMAFLSSPGTGDRAFWQQWLADVETHGIVAGFKVNAEQYPPLTAVIFWMVARFADLFSLDNAIAIKLSLVAFLYATSLAFWIWTKDALSSIALYLFLILNSVLLTYVDIYFGLTFVLSLWALHQGRLALFSALYFLSCLTKWQPIIIAPFILFYILDLKSIAEWRRIDLKRLVGASVPALSILVLMWLLFGNVFFRAFGAASTDPYLSGSALNAHWILTYYLQATHPETYGALHHGEAVAIEGMTPASVVLIAKILFGVSYLAALFSFFRQDKTFENLIIYSFIGFWAYFIINTGVHENHLFLPAVLSATLFWLNREHFAVSTFTLVTGSVNLVLFYGVTGKTMPFSRVAGIDMSVLISLVNVLFFVSIWSGALFLGGAGVNPSSGRRKD